MAKIWTPDEVAIRLEDAALTLRRLPFPANGAPSGHRVAWPEIVRRTWHDAAKGTRNRPPLPDMASVTRMDEALNWLLFLVPGNLAIGGRRERLLEVVWARALGVSWRRLEDRLDRSVTALRMDYRDTLLLIAARLTSEARVAELVKPDLVLRPEPLPAARDRATELAAAIGARPEPERKRRRQARA